MEPTNIEAGAFFVGVLTGTFISMFGLICGWYLGAKCSDNVIQIPRSLWKLRTEETREAGGGHDEGR